MRKSTRERLENQVLKYKTDLDGLKDYLLELEKRKDYNKCAEYNYKIVFLANTIYDLEYILLNS